MGRNVELLEKVMQHIEDHPEEHYQGYWFAKDKGMWSCGTAACFAGHAVVMCGYKPVFNSSDARSEYIVSPGGAVQHIGEVAHVLLGLTFRESNILFQGDNTREALKLMVKDLVNNDELRECSYYKSDSDSSSP